MLVASVISWVEVLWSTSGQWAMFDISIFKEWKCLACVHPIWDAHG